MKAVLLVLIASMTITTFGEMPQANACSEQFGAGKTTDNRSKAAKKIASLVGRGKAKSIRSNSAS